MVNLLWVFLLGGQKNRGLTLEQDQEVRLVRICILRRSNWHPLRSFTHTFPPKPCWGGLHIFQPFFAHSFILTLAAGISADWQNGDSSRGFGSGFGQERTEDLESQGRTLPKMEVDPARMHISWSTDEFPRHRHVANCHVIWGISKMQVQSAGGKENQRSHWSFIVPVPVQAVSM